MQINRLFETVYILLNKKTTTARELAEHFEVSKRTVMRDIEILSQAGIPIYTTPGRGGGISILDNFVLDKAAITEEEQNQILFALQSLGSTEQAGAADILSKLRALFDKTETDWIEVDFSRWGDVGSNQEKFEALKHAILQKHAISFTYSSSYGETAGRTAYPLKLVFKSKAWYLQAFCRVREDYRIFKVNRMSSIAVMPESFSRERFSPPPVDSFEPLQDGLTHLVLDFSNRAAYRIYDEFDPEDVVQNEDGTFTVTTDLLDGPWLYGFLLSFGTDVRVIAPECVRLRLLHEVERMKEAMSCL